MYEAHLAHILHNGGSNYRQPWDACPIQNPAPLFPSLPKHRKYVLNATAGLMGPEAQMFSGNSGDGKDVSASTRVLADSKGARLLKLSLDRRLAVKKWISVLERFPADFDLSLQAAGIRSDVENAAACQSCTVAVCKCLCCEPFGL